MPVPRLQYSIFLLWGMAAGAGLAAPIVLMQAQAIRWRAAIEAGEPLALLGFGIYLLAVALLGTWSALGAFGVWAGRTGGRGARLAVQIAGIVAVAALTLPLASVLTLYLMAWKGRAAQAPEPSPFSQTLRRKRPES
ncbi:MAG: hypothetical protein AMXMBFR7_15530 [Planctomycetota bacterium]